eukprot:4718145-Heterocapsa_arctica.AAC.1
MVCDSCLVDGKGKVKSSAVGGDVNVVRVVVVVIRHMGSGGEIVVLGDDGGEMIYGVARVTLKHTGSSVDVFDVYVNELLFPVP